MVQPPARNHAQRGNHHHYARMTHPNTQRHVVPTSVLTKSKLVPLTTARPVTTAVPQPLVTRPRPAKNVVTKSHSPSRRTINLRPSPTPNESLYDSWTRFKDIIRKVPNHGLSIWALIEIFLKYLDSLSRHIINLTAEGDLRKFSDIGAWYAIEYCAQYDKKKCSNPTNAISDETIANPNAQIVKDDMVRVQVPRCIGWLNYNEHVDSLSMMDNEVGVTSPGSTIQTLSSFEEYTPPVTYPEEVKKILGTPIEVEPLNETKLQEVGLNCNHNTPFSSREVPSFDKPKPQPQHLPNFSPLDTSLRTKRGLKPSIKPQSPNSFRMNVLDNLTIHTPPSYLEASFYLRDLYCYYRLCINDPKKHYGFKPGF
nr:ribonuclease H-like domain-containing protein [Tanacetum cinerariifolium]